MPTQQDRELIPLSTAVLRVYTKITGASLSPFGGPLIDPLLNDVAQAMADLVTIYGGTHEKEPLRPLPVAEVKHGAFHRAATVLRKRNGTEYQRLHIRRCDARAAAGVLKKSKARFASIEEILVASEASIGQAFGGETEASFRFSLSVL